VMVSVWCSGLCNVMVSVWCGAVSRCPQTQLAHVSCHVRIQEHAT